MLVFGAGLVIASERTLTLYRGVFILCIQDTMRKAGCPTVQRIMHAQQYALKMIANVSYGYTAAGFSGRMPSAQLADAVVSCGRNCTRTAIDFITNHKTWRAEVVYGDTDSMFVKLAGRTQAEAHALGREMAARITQLFPDPVP